ncbi:MAG: Cobalt-zinc-cadmium resistance protein CzcC [Verrucomicrobiae bacterium]|nr:Cobalt-zinc-cadmium resistance protein CzcC [Verrucomicrobiae bacterium]
MNDQIYQRVRIVVLSGLLAGAGAAWAEPKEIASSLTLDQMVSAALTENAQLHSMRAKWEAMRERPVQATTLPNPMFKYGGMDMTDGGTWPNTNEKRFMVEQEFPWAGKLGLRGKVATKEAEAMQREYEAMVREVIMMVKENYFDLYAVQRSLSITRTEEDVLKRMEQIAQTKYGVGEVTQQDVLKAQAEISMLKQQLYELEQQEVVLKAKLNQLLNRRADSSLGLAVTEPQRELQFKAEELFGLAEKMRPEIKKAQADIQRNQYDRDLMKKEFFPDYRLGVEYRNFGDSPNMVMFTVGFDLPIWQKKYKAGVRQAEKMIESSKAGLEAVQKQTSFDVQDAYFKLATARRTLDLYKTALIPQAEARYKASEAGYRTGKVDFMDLLESQRFLLNARVMAAMAEGNVGMQLGRLERAVGTDLKPVEQPVQPLPQTKE